MFLFSAVGCACIGAEFLILAPKPKQRGVRYGSFATGLGKLQVEPCPQWPESDGSLEKGALS
jgi:hypothetical protein